MAQWPMGMGFQGQNAMHGPDNGPPPPYMARHAYPAGSVPMGPAFQMPPSVPMPAFGGIAAMPTFGGMAMVAFNYVQPIFALITSGFPGGSTHPAGPNPPDFGVPGIHLRNHTGGVGAPAGYNYLFPMFHAQVHVFITKQKPWQHTLPSNDTRTHIKLMVPINLTMMELMQQLGCNNDDPTKNALVEVMEKGGGNWASGMKFTGDNEDRMRERVADQGWHENRGVVWLWRTSDGL